MDRDEDFYSLVLQWEIWEKINHNVSMWQRKRRKWLIKSKAMSPYGKMSSLGWGNGMNPFIFKTQWLDDCSQKTDPDEAVDHGADRVSYRCTKNLNSEHTFHPQQGNVVCDLTFSSANVSHLGQGAASLQQENYEEERGGGRGRCMKRRKEEGKGKQRGKEVEEKNKRQEKQKREGERVL